MTLHDSTYIALHPYLYTLHTHICIHYIHIRIICTHYIHIYIGGFDEETVSQMHFGGFERAPGEDMSRDTDTNRPKTRKEIMAEVIAKSKLHKVCSIVYMYVCMSV